jgi:hypothetical protein
VLFGAPAEGRPLRDGRQPTEAAGRLYFALGFAPPAQVAQGSGFSGAAWVRLGSFSVYRVKLHLICATDGVPLCYELTPANVADVSLAEELIDEAAPWGWGSEEALGGAGLPKRGVEGGLGRGGHPSGDGAIRAAARGQAASGDRHLQPQEGVRPQRDAGEHPRGACHQDRGEDSGLHLRLRAQQDVQGGPQGRIKELWA